MAIHIPINASGINGGGINGKGLGAAASNASAAAGLPPIETGVVERSVGNPVIITIPYIKVFFAVIMKILINKYI